MVGNLKKWGGTPQAEGGRRTQACELSPPPGVAAGCLLRKESDISDRTKEPGTVISCGDGEFTLRARRKHPDSPGAEQIVRFEWSSGLTFGEMLEHLGRVPIPPYLGRDSAQIDLERYQTVYSRFEGSVAAPTAGLHFTPGLIAELQSQNIDIEEVTLHVGAGTFLPVKVENALDHPMHIEHFEVTLATVERLLARMNPRDSVQPEATPGGGLNSPPAGSGPHSHGKIIAVGTTSVRTIESLPTLAWRIFRAQNLSDTESYLSSEADKFGADRRFEGEDSTESTDSAEKQGGVKDSRLSRQIPVGQFEWRTIPANFTGAQALQILAEYMRANGLQKLSAATQIMITPGFRFRLVSGIVTNFHQPKSTLLLLVSAFVGGENRSQNEDENGNPKDDQSIAKNPENWRRIYDYALSHDFRFLSYGDSSLLLK